MIATTSLNQVWRRALQQRDANVPNFVPVRIVPDKEPAPASRVEVVLAGGRRLRVLRGFDPATVRELLAVLEKAPPYVELSSRPPHLTR